MDHLVELSRRHDLFHRRRVCQIALFKLEGMAELRQLMQIAPFKQRIIEIIQIVKRRDRTARSKQPFAHVRPNKPCSAGHEEIHGRTVTRGPVDWQSPDACHRSILVSAAAARYGQSMSLIIFRHGWITAIALALLSVSAPGTKAASPGRVNVILWFDTEDYLLPADDDACKRLADMLTARGIRATFKVVGEKARVLEQRGRQDVIDALKKHDIAYHANFHSVHPTPAEYMADCGLLDGIAEFVRREGPGAADVRRVFGVESLSCYGQPGSSWASQAVAALKQIGVTSHGIPCYVDEGDHVGLNGQPFWFAGALVVYHMAPNYTRMELHDPAAVGPAKQEVSQIADRLRSQRGLISIFYHPCEWVHREFWDGVNFRRGSNPPREQWKAPPQRTTAETDGAFQRFGEYIDHIRSIPDVRFVTARDLPDVYPT